MAFFQSISLFPYANWWRFEGKQELKSYCGGISTLIIFILVGIIFGFKLAQVFNRSKMTVSQTFDHLDLANFNTFTTYQNDTNMAPFMAAIDLTPQFLTGTGNLTSHDFTAVGSSVSQTSSNITQYPFQLQSCTVDHFSKLPNIASSFYSRGMHNWMCLPLNKNFSFGGDKATNLSTVKISISCSTDNCKNEKNNLQFNYYLLKNTANPYSELKPLTNHISQYTIQLFSNDSYQTKYRLDLNTIIIDRSILPQSDIKVLNAYTIDNDIRNRQDRSSSPQAVILFQRSRVSYTYKRTYEKLLDAVAYIGGIFQSILALFIFIQFFNVADFQMSFAYKYFKCIAAKDFYFGKAIKQFTYDLLYNTKFKPQWHDAQLRRNIKEAVTSLQDIIYINRRIEFLQKATSILFQSHQLKGLRLLSNYTDKEVVKDYKSQKFREKMISFLKRNDNQNKEQKQLLRSRGNFTQGEANDKQDKNPNRQACQIIIGSQEKREVKAGSRNAQGLYTSQIIFKDQLHRSGQEKLQQRKSQIIYDSTEENELAEQNNSETDDLLIQEIEGDLKKLFIEAQEFTEDKMSKRIYEKIDEQLRQKLKTRIYQFDKQKFLRIQQVIVEGIQAEQVKK